MKIKRICALGLCGVMTFSLVGCSAEDVNPAASITSSAEEKELQETVEQAADVNSGSGEFEKEETVYIISDAAGTKKEVIVSDWLKNMERTENLEDLSELTDIKNVKGEESFEQGGEHGLTWNANGADIYYQGSTDKESPVEVKVTYYLDDKEISSEELAGKSGKVKMHFQYKNNAKEGNIYTPFMMVTGMILPQDNFSNIEVENGKNISDGTNNIIIGYGLPGLNESLDLKSVSDDIDVDILDGFEVTADVKDFKLSMTMTVATSDLLKDVDTDKIDTSEIFDELDDKINEFQDGTSELFDGIKKYTDGVRDLKDGTDDLKDGTKTLSNGTSKLRKGTEQAKTGAKKLNQGADSLKSGIAQAKSGSKQLKDGYEGKNGAVAGAKALSEGLSTLNKKVAGLSLPSISTDASLSADERQEVAATIKKNLEDSLPAAVTNYLTAAGITDPEIQLAVKNAYMAAYQTAYQQAYQGGIKFGAGLVSKKVTETVASMSGSITELKTGVAQLATGSSQLSAGIGKLYEGTKKVDTGLGQLYQGSTDLKKGTTELAKGSKSLDNGAKDLEKGSKDLDQGAGKLKNGAAKLNHASDDLVDGGKKLQEGTGKLADKYSDAKDNIIDFTDRLKKIVEAGKNYQSFAGKKDGVSGSVKFIIKTDAIVAE